MKDFSEPYFQKAGVDKKVWCRRKAIIAVHMRGCGLVLLAGPLCLCLPLHIGKPKHHSAAQSKLYLCWLQVSVVVGPANEGIATLARQGVRFDLAFLDADKGGYLSYFNQVWKFFWDTASALGTPRATQAPDHRPCSATW